MGVAYVGNGEVKNSTCASNWEKMLLELLNC
jgi:hypothetical protein